jgi:tetratricopeptide (TPR) repeat protein
MKKFIILTIITAAVVAGAIVYLNKQKTSAPPAPVPLIASTQSEPQPEEIVSTAKPQPPPPVATPALVLAPAAAVAPVATNIISNEETNSIRKTVDALLAARSGKHAMFQQLNKDQLEAVIADLQQRAVANPNDAEIPTTLGEAQLNLVRTLHESGSADQDQVGILAMQADQNFNAALKIDPQNWEAQFVKAATMVYWPPNEARDNNAAQMLSHLIDQQETLPQQPEFAQTYLALGNQYQKMGKLQEAMATWTLGAQKFPSDPALQGKIRGQ